MALGHVREGNFSKGTPITPAHSFGNQVTLGTKPSNDFGNPNPSNQGNVNKVTWAPAPNHFGNSIGGVPVTPTFSPAAGSYTQPQVVLILAAGADAVYFSTDGSTPTTASRLYTGSVRVNKSQTLKAIAVTKGVASAVGTSAYVIS